MSGVPQSLTGKNHHFFPQPILMKNAAKCSTPGVFMTSTPLALPLFRSKQRLTDSLSQFPDIYLTVFSLAVLNAWPSLDIQYSKTDNGL